MGEPSQRHAFGQQAFLEGGSESEVSIDVCNRSPALETEGGERSRCLADVPFDVMQPVDAVGQMGDGEVFTGGEQVFDACWAVFN